MNKESGQADRHSKQHAIIELIRRSRSRHFGVRPERFLIDETIGTAFAKEARNSTREPLAVFGPPFRCEVYRRIEAGEGGPGGHSGGADHVVI